MKFLKELKELKLKVKQLECLHGKVVYNTSQDIFSIAYHKTCLICGKTWIVDKDEYVKLRIKTEEVEIKLLMTKIKKAKDVIKELKQIT